MVGFYGKLYLNNVKKYVFIATSQIIQTYVRTLNIFVSFPFEVTNVIPRFGVSPSTHL